MKKALLFSVCLMMLMPCAITANGGEEKKGDETVTISITYPGGPDEFKIFQDALDLNKDKMPGIETELIHVAPAQFWDKVTTMYAGNQQPDVTFMSEPFIRYVSSGLLLELDDMINSSEFDRSDWFQAGLEFFKYEGKHYGIPKDLNSTVVFYNKDLFDAAGMPYPSRYVEEGNWTWDTYLEMAKALTLTENGKVTQYGTTIWVGPRGWPYAGQLYSFGGRFWNDDQTVCLLDSPQAVKAYTYFTDLVMKHKVAPIPAQQSELGFSFNTGKIAMDITGSWSIGGLKNSEINYDLVPLPTDKGIAPFTGYTHIGGFSASKKTEYPEAAKKVLLALTSREMQTTLAEMGIGSVPPRISIAESDSYIKAAGVPKGVKYMSPILANGMVFPHNLVSDRIDTTIIGSNFEAVMNDELSINEAIKNTVESTNELLNK